MQKLRVVFIGGLTNGAIVHRYLIRNRYVEVVGAVTYAADHPGAIDAIPDSHRTGSVRPHLDELLQLAPDLIMVAGWSELLPQALFDLPPMGCIGFHPSKLPLDRGRSVIAWQLEEGYEETALTMFYYSDIPDGGDIIGQDRVPIAPNDHVADILRKMDRATTNLMRAYFPLLRMGKAPRRPQDINAGNFRRLRTNRDSQIDWATNSRDIYNKIRAISHPYPGAEGRIGEERYNIQDAECLAAFPFGEHLVPGRLVATLHDATKIVRTRDGFIHLKKLRKLEQP